MSPDRHKQPSLLAQVGPDTGWRAPEQLPVLDDRFRRLGFDSEWTGTDWLGDDVPVGYSFALEDGRKFYLPVGHQGGGNLDKALVHRWMNRELKNKTLVTLSGKGDIQMCRKVGVDLEALGCSIEEVQYQAALLSDIRRSFKMEDLANDYLGQKKIEIQRKDIWQLPAYEVGPYAEEDAAITLRLGDFLGEKIKEEELDKVLALENSLIYCVCEMERNGVPLDYDKLFAWKGEIKKRSDQIILLIAEGTGLKVNPNSAHDLAQLFGLLGIGYNRTPPTGNFPNGQPSFTDEFLATIDNEFVHLIREGRTLDSLDSKYVGKYAAAIRRGILHYQLHQLKGDEAYGTISGRFSSSKVNIQQVFDPERQADKMGRRDYIIRQLFLPGKGMKWLKADASQIEFRLFVHYSRSARLIKIFNETPDVDFHQQVADLCSIKRKPAKNINFGKLFGMGRDKMARELGLPRSESDVLFAKYDQKFPETKNLMEEVMGVARNRGYVKTILGRRARFPNGERLHSALNRVIQGSAADILKIKLLELYNNRKALGFLMRLTVHDEVGGDVESKEQAAAIKEMLEAPIPGLGIRVPLLWDVTVANNWGEASWPKEWSKAA
jgi:DNA polymerase-1